MEVYVIHGEDYEITWMPKVFISHEEGMNRIKELMNNYSNVKFFNNHATYSSQDNGEEDGYIELIKCKLTV